MATKKQIHLNHSSYNDAYKGYYANKKDYDVIKMIKYALLRDSKNKRLLNIGPGANPSEFIEQVINNFDEIVLLEVNPIFVKLYKKQEWYIKNLNKIKIYLGKIEEIESNFISNNLNSFDIIFVNNVIYHFLKNDIKYIILPKLNKLLKLSGYILISVFPDYNPFVTK
eukprot:231984_1